MAQSQNKLVGTQYLDLTRLRKDVADTNALLKSIGAGINLNMSDVVEKQVKDMLTRFKTEIQNASAQTMKSGQQMASGLASATTQIQSLVSATQKLNKDGSLTETRKGFDDLNRSITEVWKNGQLLTRSRTTDSVLTKDIEYANKLYQEQVAYLKQVYALKTQRLTTQDGTPAAQNIDSQIVNAERLIDANNQLIALLGREAISRSKLVQLSGEEAAIAQKYVSAQIAQQEKLNAAQQAQNSGVKELSQAQAALKQQTQAQRSYITAVKNGDQVSQTYWRQSAQSAMSEIQSIESKIGSLNLEEGTRKRLLNVIQQAKDAEQTHVRNLDQLNSGTTKLDESQNRIGSRLLQMAATMLVLRGLTTMWRNATTYAQQYYDKLNEIRIVTGRTEAEANKLGQSYRKMAAQMSVASTDIAKAAVEFWRQGQDEDEVNRRLVAATQYAKISAIEFDEAAELVTAATNTMDISAQHVVDVFTYLGDASAAGASDIGKAMQKASASAQEFGVTFEWLGAYIATISEKTRQAPEVIGTSLNSIMARLHSIKQRGFNEEDETRINDIAKALATLEMPIKLIDEATGEWRDMPTIFKEIAEQWGDLDAKQRAYISTTMAGTRQQNYFLALMSDMAKGAEGGSRAFELYEGAMTASGTASQKYAIWQESVAAAQNRLTAAMQEFYALLNADWMKGFYDGMADLVNIITAGTDALGGWNLMIPAIAVGVTGLIAIIYKAVVAIKVMRAALIAGQGIATALSGGAIGAILAAVGVIATVVTMIAGAAASANEVETIDYSGTIEKVSSYRDNIDGLVSELETLASKTDLTAEEQARADEIMKTLSGTSLSMKEALEGGGEGFDTLGEKAAAARGEVEKTDQALRSLNAADALQSLRDADHAYADTIKAAQETLQASSQYGDIADAYAAYMAENTDGTYRQGYSGPRGSYATRDENFYVYAQNKADQPKPIWYSSEDKARIQADRDFWAGIVAEMDQLGIGYSTSVEVISNKMLEFDIAAASYAEANQQRLAEAWQPIMDDLYTIMTDGTQFSQLPQFMQTAATSYYESYVAGIDQQKALAEGDLMAMAADLTNYVSDLFAFIDNNPEFFDLINDFDALYSQPRTLENVDALNALVPQINEYIKAYNALTETTDDDIPLLTDILPTDEAEQAAQNLQLLSDALESYFAKAKKAKEAENAKENLYGDQLMDLRAAWEQNDGGASFVNMLNEMYAANDTLTEGMLETHEALADMADGTLTYEEGLAALSEMERLATIQAQERTKEMLDEAEAAKALAAAQKDHYQGVLAQLQAAYDIGYGDFVAEWDSLSDDMKSDIIELYPEVAALASVTGEAADGATVFAEAMAKAATLDFSKFKESLTTDYAANTKKAAASQAADNGYKDQLGSLQTALATGGVDAMRLALFSLREENEELYTGLMSTYTMLYQLGDMSLTNAQAADMLSGAYLQTAESSAKAAQEMRAQMAQEEAIAAAAKNYHADTLKSLQAAYAEGGTKGFHAMWDTLDEDTQEYIMKTYSAVGNLACEAIDQSKGVVDAIFEEALADAAAMREELLRQSITEDAQEYMTGRPVADAKENGYQDQLIQLRDSLADGTFMETLTGFGEEMSSALIAENEWINEVIHGMEVAEEGTYSLDEATTILNEHIYGTKEYLLAMAETMTESNTELLSTEEEQIAMLAAMLALLEEGGIDAFAAAFGELSEEMQEALIDSSPALKKFFKNLASGSEDATDAIDDLEDELDDLNLKKLQKDGKVWDSLTDAMEDAAKGGKDFSKSYGAVIKQTEDLTEAQGALAAIQNGTLTSTDDLTDAYNILASYCGVSADSLRNNLDPAIWAISSDMNMASNSAAYLANWLWQTAGVTFSAGNWQAQLAALAASADSTTANVARLVQTMLQCAGANLSLGADGTINVHWGGGSYTPPSARSGGGGGSRGGGGGGGSSNTSVSKKTQKLLDEIDSVQDLRDHRRELAQLAQEYHESRGEIQGVILYLGKERDIVQENKTALEGYLAKLEAQIEAKKAEMAKYKEGSKKYKQAQADLAALQEAHQQYSLELIENMTDLEKLQQAIEDQYNAIRDMEIDLRDTILQAIKDREEREERMIEGRIDLENEITDILIARYEKERDNLIDIAERKQEALNEELDLLDQQLEARKKLADQEDRAKTLAEKEAQLARISADPTRKKEELELREEIAKLREEMAWEIAEEEVEAQKQSIEDQLTSLDDYIEYVENYYEELLSNPRKLMEEMQELLTKTDEEILAWLQQNHEDYQTATDATRESMRNGWQEMLNDMRGHTVTYWDEVEDIISQGDEAIIEFLKQNSADYREAGKLQADAYVDEWKKKLEDLKAAYKAVSDAISSYNYTPTKPSSGGGSSGGGSSGGGGTTTKRFVASGTGYAEAYKSTATTLDYSGATYVKDPKSSYWYKKSDARTIDGGRTYYWKTGTTKYVKKYLEGGLSTGTGLAWLDGTPQKPERVLSPYQTVLFEDMIKSLHEIKTLRVPTSVVAPRLPDAQQIQPMTIESITVNVERLESDADYDEMAEKVGEKIMEKVTRGMSIGGLRLG